MTIPLVHNGHGQGLPAAPAFGTAEPLTRHPAIIRTTMLAGTLVLMLLVRFSGALAPPVDHSPLPGLSATAVVVPGLVRGGQPREPDLVRMRADYRVRSVIKVDGVDVEEQAVARYLGLRTLQLDVSGGRAPSADQIRALVHFLRWTPTGPSTANGDGVAYLYDSTGQGPVLVVAAVLQVLRGEALPAVLSEFSPEERSRLTGEQSAALRQVAAATQGGQVRAGPYATLHGVTY